jgi:hypothetical protein
MHNATVVMAAVLVVWLAAMPAADAAKWKREKSNPVVKSEQLPARPGAYYPVVADPFVLYDDGIYKMWFGFGGLDNAEDPNSVAMRVGYAQSADTVAQAPALELGAEWDKTNAEAPCVLKDDTLPDGDPRKYRMYYTGMSQAGEMPEEEAEVETGMVAGIGLAFSPDGREFTRLPAAESPHAQDGLVLTPNPVAAGEDLWDFLHVSDPFVLKANGAYHMWYTGMAHEAGTEGVYFSVGYATSSDGINWYKQGHVLAPDQPWETARSEASVGRPAVLWTGERYEMFYDAVQADDNPAQNTSAGVGFAWSADGKAWEKMAGPVFTWKKGRTERAGMATGVAAVPMEGEYRLYYPAGTAEWDQLGISLVTGVPEPHKDD